jgi:hypothetical protein
VTTLISVATGRRPLTAEVALKALWLHVGDRVREGTIDLHVIRWHESAPVLVGARNLWLEGAPKPRCLNHSLEVFKHDRGDLPETWLTLDDDVVWTLGVPQRMEAVLRTDLDIWLLGAWNDGGELNRGEVRFMATGDNYMPVESIQYGVDFCVGGSTHAVPRRTLEVFGGYSERFPRREDEFLSESVREIGKQAAIARSIGVASLPDDQWDPTYRHMVRRMHYLDSELIHTLPGRGPEIEWQRDTDAS